MQPEVGASGAGIDNFLEALEGWFIGLFGGNLGLDLK